jgi:chromosome segregation ATPase
MTISPEMTALAVQIEERLAARMQLVVEPLADAILSLQQNQTTLVGAVNGLTAAVDELRGSVALLRGSVAELRSSVTDLQVGQRALTEIVDGVRNGQRTLEASVADLASRFATTERLAQVEQRLASLEARLAANDRS